MERPGRNDPCYCGSGLKYKKCHMAADQAAEKERRQWSEAGRFLRRDLIEFARDERFAQAFAAALPLYWNNLYHVENAEEMSENEALRFFDWLVFDYQPDDRPRLIELYQAERRDELSSHQQAILDTWLQAMPAGAYTLIDYHGQTLNVRDFVTGDAYEVFEPAGKGQVEPGDVLLARLLPLRDEGERSHWEFSTVAAYLPQDEIGDLADKLAAARTDDEVAHPGASVQEFMRRNNTLLIHHALAEAERKGRPPVARLDPNRPDKAAQGAARQIKRLHGAADHAKERDLDTEMAARHVKHVRTKH